MNIFQPSAFSRLYRLCFIDLQQGECWTWIMYNPSIWNIKQNFTGLIQITTVCKIFTVKFPEYGSLVILKNWWKNVFNDLVHFCCLWCKCRWSAICCLKKCVMGIQNFIFSSAALYKHRCMDTHFFKACISLSVPYLFSVLGWTSWVTENWV